MNLKILFALLSYYSLITIFFISYSTISALPIGTSYSSELNTSDMTTMDGVEPSFNFFTAIINIGRFFGFILLGIGLPSDTPAFIAITFIAWQTLLSIFTIGFIINAVWSGGGQ